MFQALLEGQGNKVEIYEKVLNVIHLDIVLYLVFGDDDEEPQEMDEDSILLRTESLVLLQVIFLIFF